MDDRDLKYMFAFMGFVALMSYVAFNKLRNDLETTKQDVAHVKTAALGIRG